MPKKAASGTTKTTKKKRTSTAKKKTATAKKKAKTTRAKAKTTATKPSTRKRAAKPAAKVAPARATRLRVRQVRSGLGHAATYRRTLEALGLRHHQDEVVIADNPSMRGMLHKVRHLIRVTPEEA